MVVAINEVVEGVKDVEATTPAAATNGEVPNGTQTPILSSLSTSTTPHPLSPFLPQPLLSGIPEALFWFRDIVNSI